jgi:spermidine/putrescine transport system permease protein
LFGVSDLLGGWKIIMMGFRFLIVFGPGRNWPYAAAMGITLLALFVITYWVFTRRRREG